MFADAGPAKTHGLMSRGPTMMVNLGMELTFSVKKHFSDVNLKDAIPLFFCDSKRLKVLEKQEKVRMIALNIECS
jgi:hypothetical protein